MGQARARPGLGLSSTPGRAARARVLQARPIYRVGQASGSSLRPQARAQLELGIWRLDPSLPVGFKDFGALGLVGLGAWEIEGFVV